LKRFWGAPSEVLFSVVVFVGDSTFKTPMPDNVTYARGCTDYIRRKTKLVLTVAQVESIVQAIRNCRVEAVLRPDLEAALGLT
jgi:hypothetical protein